MSGTANERLMVLFDLAALCMWQYPLAQTSAYKYTLARASLSAQGLIYPSIYIDNLANDPSALVDILCLKVTIM